MAIDGTAGGGENDPSTVKVHGADAIAVYSFALKPEEHQPSGTCNFSRIDNAQLTGNVVQSKGDRSWRTSELGGGGVVRDFGSHLIDTVNYLFGKSHGIEKIVRKNILSCDTEDYCSWKFRYDNYLGDCIVNWADKSVRKATLVLEIQFEKGKIIASGNGLKIESNIVVEKPLIPSEVQFYIRGEEFSRQMEVFLGVTNVSEWSSPCNFQEAYQVDRIIEELKKSELL